MMTGNAILDPSPGTYAMLLELTRRSSVSVGALGCQRLPPGSYLYVGSARGPGGLRARLAHHRRGPARPHWHIDYLRMRAPVRWVWALASTERLECEWAGRLVRAGGLEPSAARFGASDCRCPTHLLRGPVGDEGLVGQITELLSPATVSKVHWP